jgi:hypothetical protein
MRAIYDWVTDNTGLVVIAVVILASAYIFAIGWKIGAIWYPGLRRDVQKALALTKEQTESLPRRQLARYIHATRTARNLRNFALWDDPELVTAFRILDSERWRRLQNASKESETARALAELEEQAAAVQRKQKDATAARDQLGLKKPMSPETVEELRNAWAELEAAMKEASAKGVRACSRSGQPWESDPEAVRGIAAMIRELPSDPSRSA